MNPTVLALIGYISWFLVLITTITCHRALLTITGARPANSFAPDGLDISPLSGRICRAHANCYESFPYIGGLLILSLLTDMSHLTDSLALFVLIFRILQSSIHIASTSVFAVQIRFGFFTAQLFICIYWAVIMVMYQLGI